MTLILFFVLQLCDLLTTLVFLALLIFGLNFVFARGVVFLFKS